MFRTGAVAVVAASLILAGCQTTAQQENPPIWGRIDCQRAVENPQLTVLFEQAKLVCQNRADAAGTAGTAGMPTGRGIGGAIASGIAAGITHAQISVSTAKSCMAEYGFMLASRQEHEMRCVSVRAAMAPPPATTSPATARRTAERTRRPAARPRSEQGPSAAPMSLAPTQTQVAPTSSVQTVPSPAARGP